MRPSKLRPIRLASAANEPTKFTFEQRSTRNPAKSSARRCCDTPVRRLSVSSATSWPANRSGARFTSSPTICRRTRRRRCARSCWTIQTSISTSHRPIRHGSTRSSSGLRRSNATCWRGVFTSVADLARKIRRYIRHYNKVAKPVRWSYRNPAHRIGSTSESTVHWCY